MSNWHGCARTACDVAIVHASSLCSPGASNSGGASHWYPISCWFVVEAVLLRRCQYGAPVHTAVAQAWRTGVALIQNCIARRCLSTAAPAVWESTLQFAPSHIDVLRFGEVDSRQPQVHPLSTSLAQRSFLYHSLIKSVPATLAGERPTWWERFPPDVAEFIQRAAFYRDLDRVSRLAAKEPESVEGWLALLYRQHAVFRNKHILLRKVDTIGTPNLPAGLPNTFH